MARYSSLLQPMISFISASERYSGRRTGSTCVRTVCLCVCVCTHIYCMQMVCAHTSIACRCRHAVDACRRVSMACRFFGGGGVCMLGAPLRCVLWCGVSSCTHKSAVNTHICSVLSLQCTSSRWGIFVLRRASRRHTEIKQRKALFFFQKKYTWLSTSASRALSSA
jgi:hypothetical protein